MKKGSTMEVKDEDDYNPSGYADYLENEHYHHSDKGCQIKMEIIMGNRPGEIPYPGVIKRCLTHNVICSKTGWEKGWYGGNKTIYNICECGNEIDKKKHFCEECRLKHNEENKKRGQIKAREIHQATKKYKKIPKTLKNPNK